MRFRNFFGLFALIVMLGAARAHATETFESELVAGFEFTILSSGPLHGAGFPEDVPISFQARGMFLFELDDALNNPAATTVPFVSATGTLVGFSPPPFLPFDIRPIEFVGGNLTNIVRDGGGSVISADVDALSMKWEMNAVLGGGPVRLYTRDGLPFDAAITSIPFSEGTILTGPDVFNVYLDGVDEPPAVEGRNRTLRVVPEPTSLALLGTAFGLIACFGRRRRRR